MLPAPFYGTSSTDIDTMNNIEVSMNSCLTPLDEKVLAALKEQPNHIPREPIVGLERRKNAVKMHCSIHDYDYERKVVDILRKRAYCPLCSRKGMTRDEWILLSRFVWKGEVEFDYSKIPSPPPTYQQKITLTCLKHNEEFVTTASAHLKGVRSCRECLGQRAPYTVETAIERFREIHGPDRYDYSKFTEIKGAHSPLTIICHRHDEPVETTMTVWHHIKSRRGCKSCTAHSVRLNRERFLARAKPVWGDRFDYSNTVVTGIKNVVTFVCTDCGEECEQTPDGHFTGREPCRTCYPAGTSGLEGELAAFVEAVAQERGLKVERNRRGLLAKSNLEVDIYLPDLKLAIEFNGMYFHSEAFNAPDHHKVKRELCEAAGLRLLTVWEDDWLWRRPIVEEHLRHLLGASQQERVFARKCEVREVAKPRGDDLLLAHHIQGPSTASVRLGLFKDEELVAVAYFRRTKDEIWELSRYATNKLVVGGASKLVAAFRRAHPSAELKTFADLDWSAGELYENTGWRFDGELEPDYSYLYKGERRHKFGFRKNRFREDPNLKFESGLSERELASLNKILRVYDSGKKRYFMPALNAE